jgi:5-methylcytosine-specific restriction endonuclease McrA
VSKPVACICKTCHQEFLVESWRFNKQGATWCSKSCRSAGVILKCGYCGVEFRRKPSAANRHTKSGAKYCTGRCSSLATVPKGPENWTAKPKVTVCCFSCGKQTERPPYLAGKVFVCSKQCHQKYQSIKNRGRFSGEKHHNWKGGISFLPYPPTWTHGLREYIRDRDGRRCRICGIDELRAKTKRLHVHHIDYVKAHIHPDNLAALCPSCHMKTNFNREIWILWFADHPAVLFKAHRFICA